MNVYWSYHYYAGNTKTNILYCYVNIGTKWSFKIVYYLLLQSLAIKIVQYQRWSQAIAEVCFLHYNYVEGISPAYLQSIVALVLRSFEQCTTVHVAFIATNSMYLQNMMSLQL